MAKDYGSVQVQLPLLGSGTGWTPPKEFPNLSGEKEIGLDTETCDPGLAAGEAPDPRRGYVAGISIAVPDKSWYFPIAHSLGHNMDKEQVLRFVQDAVKGKRVIGANCSYDGQFLEAEGIDFSETSFFDVQYAAAILDETHLSYSLDACSWRDLGKKKEDASMVDWIMKATRCTKRQAKGMIHIAPSDVVGPYAEVDAELPLLLKKKYVPDLKRQGLIGIAEIEMGQIPIIMEMRRRGIRVDLERATNVRNQIRKTIEAKLYEWKQEHGIWLDMWSGDSLLNFLNKFGYSPTKRTAPTAARPTGAPSFTADWFESFPEGHIVREVGKLRKLDRLVSTFIDSYILGKNVNGRIHCQFHPLRRGDDEEGGSTDGGTVSGRYSSSDPNLQNIPYRDKFAGPLMRSFFLPDHGDTLGCIDYSQIEYRMLAHCAVGRGADLLRQRYCEDPTVDYHQMTSDMITEKTGRSLGRPLVKNINFGFVFGMGEKKLREYLGLNEEEGAELFGAYHTTFPFVRKTNDAMVVMARTKNEIRTILGRRRTFALYVPRRGYAQPLPYALAVKAYGNDLAVHGTHKALNAFCQGSAADVLKKAMLMLFKAKLTSGAAKLLLTVHDELVFSLDSKNAPELLNDIKYAMEHAVQALVPIIASAKLGANWNEAK